ncbi:MFS general substrate transporter [Karstenula rhodostoma CBS 690.94]|uniref:MFS general substrate transporter n=1 Tax=Karstenula rhodostoma CBS 690.94 TaxID=1392251 RepID=A0A9P4PFI1_9PLEO|nr:MFS general substrate transporter [Karstenula rhodostoma CBS 690.94]
MSGNQPASSSQPPDDQKSTMAPIEAKKNVSKNEFDWDTDGINPLNWTVWKRTYDTVLPAVFGLVVTFVSSIYTSAVADITRSFQVSQTIALLPFSLFFVGPLSERYRRTATYLISMPLFAVFLLGSGFSPTFAGLTICRFLTGVFASPPLVVDAGTNATLWLPQDRTAMTTLFALFPYLGPALRPVVGGFTAASKGWRWTQWAVLFSAVVAVHEIGRWMGSYCVRIHLRRAYADSVGAI